jgi:hypothetical protein
MKFFSKANIKSRYERFSVFGVENKLSRWTALAGGAFWKLEKIGCV